VTVSSGAGLLAGRTALVTGGARGIGAAIASSFAEAGAAGVVLDLDPSSAEPPPGWRALLADVRDERSLAAAIDAGAVLLDGLDVVVANAGVVPPWRRLSELDLGEWDEVFAVNVRGVASTIKHAVPVLRESGGSILVTASMNSWRAHPRQCLYTATKHAVLGIVRCAALDLGPDRIRVNAIAPGPVSTDALLTRMAHRAASGGPSVDEALGLATAETALRRLASAADVGGVAVFLASPLAASITGQLVPVDGGVLL